MTTQHATRVIRTLAAILILATAGTAHARTTDLGTLDSGLYSFGNVLSFGESFTDHVSFTLDTAADVASFIKSFDMSLLGFDLIGIDNFTASLQRATTSGYTTLFSATATSPISFDDFLAPGSYRLSIGGTASGFFGGLYRGTLQVAAVPEVETWLMILIGVGIVLYQLGRKQRSLERQPLLAA